MSSEKADTNRITRVTNELKEKVDSGVALAEGGAGPSGEDVTGNIAELQTQIDTIRQENIQLTQQNAELRENIAKEESNKTLLQQAKNKMTQMTENKEQTTRELIITKTLLDQRTEEHENVIRNLKSQYEARMQRLEKEVNELKTAHAEVQILSQQIAELRENLAKVESIIEHSRIQRANKTTQIFTTEKSTKDASSHTTNVKLIAGPSQQSATVQPWRGSGASDDSLLTSTRPISLQNSRTGAVIPTINVQAQPGASTASVTALVPPQQQVHTFGSQPAEAVSRSPTSSHTNYMPATSSVVVTAIPPMKFSSQAESSSQSQEVEPVLGVKGSSSTSSQIVTRPTVEQAVALVSPRVQAINTQAPSTSGGVTLPQPTVTSHHHASSYNTVTTTGFNKRSRDVEGDILTSNNDATEQKRPRAQEGTFQGASEPGLEIECQIPTSTQRDQEDDPMTDEGIDGDGIENDYQEMDEGPDIDEMQNNEVKNEDVSVVPEQSEQEQSQNPQQIQSTTSGSNGADEADTSTSQWRKSPNASTSHQQTQHLLLKRHMFQDESSDAHIVPNTSTLYRSSNDGFSEVVVEQDRHSAARTLYQDVNQVSKLEDKKLRPEVSTYIITHETDVNDLQKFCMENPVVNIKQAIPVFKFDGELFSTAKILLTDKNRKVEIRVQDTKRRDKDRPWICQSIREQMTIQKYFNYQKKWEKNDNQSSVVKFGTNFDISNDKVWAEQHNEIRNKLPSFLHVSGVSDMLSLVGYKIHGVNTVQVYMKIKNCRTPAHQENLNLCSVNINVGPGRCKWYVVPEGYSEKMKILCKEKRVDFLKDSWWPIEKDLEDAKIPLIIFVQEAGDIVFISPGSIHWVVAEQFCNNVAWNIGPYSVQQYQHCLTRYYGNKTEQFESLVPMIRLSWNIAKHVKVTDEKLFHVIKNFLKKTLEESRQIMKFVKEKNVECVFYKHFQDKKEAKICMKCKVELYFMTFYHKEERKIQQSLCIDCVNENQEYFYHIDHKLEDKQKIFDAFQMN